MAVERDVVLRESVDAARVAQEGVWGLLQGLGGF